MTVGTIPPFAEIFDRAAARHGGDEALTATLTDPKNLDELIQIPDDRWLSAMAKCIFQSGFNWKVVDNKWPAIEEAFHHFDLTRMRFMSDDEFDAYLKDERVIRNAQKIMAIRENAQFLHEINAEYGSPGKAFGGWPANDYVGLLDMLKARGARLGGITGSIFLRRMGVDGFILTKDVNKALIAAGVVDKPPTSKRDMAAVQAAFNGWQAESGRPFTHLSRILACSVE